MNFSQIVGHESAVMRAFSGNTPIGRILRNASWLFGAGGIRAALGLVQGILVARALGVELYGILAIITSFTGFMEQALSSRSWEMGIKFVSGFHTQKDETRALAILKLGYLIDIIAAVLSFSLAWAFADWGATVFLKAAQYADAIKLYAFVLLLHLNGGTIVLARIFNRYDLLAKVGVLQNAFHLVLVAVALIWFRAGLNGLLVTYIIASAFSLVMGLLVFRHLLKSKFKESFWKTRLGLLRPYASQIAGFLLSSNLTDIFKIVQKNGATLALGYLSAPVQAGYFKLALSFANRLALIYDPIFHSAYPELTNLWSKHRVKEIVTLLGKLVKTLAPIGVFAVVMALLAGRTFIGLTVGDQYLPAAGVLIVLVCSQAIAGTMIWLGPSLLAIGRPGWRTVAVAVGTVAMLAGMYVLIPMCGAVGAAISVIFCHIAWAVVGSLKLFESLRAHDAEIPCGNTR